MMEERRNPIDCKYYPLCEHLKEMVREIPTDLLLKRTIALQKKAESVCRQCYDFEPKEINEDS